MKIETVISEMSAVQITLTCVNECILTTAVAYVNISSCMYKWKRWIWSTNL